MSNMDPVSDLLTRIRNAHLAKHDRVDVPTSSLKTEICRILRDEGFIRNYKLVEQRPQSVLRIFLEYDENGTPAISHLRRISKPGRRIYRGADQIRPVLGGRGLGVISTNLGVLSDSQARERRVGGEILCEVW
ncbi:MAG: 30S ribosomal protein S8 [Thermoanaerobaculia bacterium]|nr:MAG: 30S ribosomal protein S8 [Thermoanaerobaculia bacterium]